MDGKMFLTIDQANARLDNHVNTKIDTYLREYVLSNYNYTKDDLYYYINDSETLLDYIRDSEDRFGLDKCDTEKISVTELNYYIMKLDLMWSLLYRGENN